jgi:hypothetical protein
LEIPPPWPGGFGDSPPGICIARVALFRETGLLINVAVPPSARVNVAVGWAGPVFVTKHTGLRLAPSRTYYDGKAGSGQAPQRGRTLPRSP